MAPSSTPREQPGSGSIGDRPRWLTAASAHLANETSNSGRGDGAGPWRFFIHIAIPLSRTNIAALFVILFIYGWNQYLWPLLITDSPTMTTIIIGIRQMIGNGDAQTAWHLVMATALLAILPPVGIVLAVQRRFVAGLIEPEK